MKADIKIPSPYEKPVKFTKAPVEVEAMRINHSLKCADDGPFTLNELSLSQCILWMLMYGHRSFKITGEKPPYGLEIETLEGTMNASPRDYIIKGVNNEFYPCKPDIFVKTYTV